MIRRSRRKVGPFPRQSPSEELEPIRRELELIRVRLGEPATGDTVASALIRLEERMTVLEQRTFERLHRAIGRIEGRQLADAGFEQSGFQVDAQTDEDGRLLWLAQLVPEVLRTFVEIGVETYVEANTRFLLTDHGWSGTILDSDPAAVSQILQSGVYLMHPLEAHEVFITTENVNDILLQHGPGPETGLLSIDIDGNDIWVWNAIEVIAPVVVVIEFNPYLGRDRAIAVPYRPDFDRRKAHPSWLYFGASLAALEIVGHRKGYALVGTSFGGNNAFFVRDEIRPASLPRRAAADLWRPCRLADFHDESGTVVKRPHADIERLLHSLPLIEVDADTVRR